MIYPNTEYPEIVKQFTDGDRVVSVIVRNRGGDYSNFLQVVFKDAPGYAVIRIVDNMISGHGSAGEREITRYCNSLIDGVKVCIVGQMLHRAGYIRVNDVWADWHTQEDIDELFGCDVAKMEQQIVADREWQERNRANRAAYLASKGK